MNYHMNLKFQIGKMKVQILNIEKAIMDKMLQQHCHSNNSYELHYISDGYGHVTVNQQTYSITPGTLYVTGPNIEHEQIADKINPMEEYCIYFELTPDSKAVSFHDSPFSFETLLFSKKFWFGTDTFHIGSLLIQVVTELENKALGYDMQVEALIKQIMVCLARIYSVHIPHDNLLTECKNHSTNISSNDINDKRCILAEQYFLYEYSSLNLACLSERLGLSIRQTQRFLAKHYGKTFHQMKLEAKMNAAAYILRHESCNIPEIAEMLGYSDDKHFHQVFKEYFKTTPRRYYDRYHLEDISVHDSF